MKLKKLIISITVFMLVFASVPGAFAASLDVDADTGSGAETVARAEVTEWRYRIYNGVSQKRLWSVTYAKWLTDWINC